MPMNASATNKTDTTDPTALIAALPEGAVVTDPDVLAAYATDRTDVLEAGMPVAVVHARSTDDVAVAVRWAHERDDAVVTPRWWAPMGPIGTGYWWPTASAMCVKKRCVWENGNMWPRPS